MKKTLALLLALVLCLPLGACVAQPEAANAAPSAETAAIFTDVPADADYAEAVAWCREKDLMNGVSDTAFDPGGTLTRAMMATVIYRAAGSPAVSGAPTFTDTEANTWYSAAVIWANDQGVIRGYGNGLFGTNDPVSVEQLEVILGRYMENGAVWVGDPAKAMAATRAQVAVALMAALKEEEESNVPETHESGKTLVAYFSATNNTKGVAEKIAAHLDADIFEIVPAEPYTSADLNYNNNSSRANREQNDPAARPAISGDVGNWDNYDVIFLGYPIWWGVPPKIIHTFMESHDFSGKTVIPFCTSGSSGYNDAAIKALAAGANWITGRRFAGGASASTVQAWVDSLGLDLNQEEETTVNKLNVTFNGHSYTAALADNPSVDAFVDYLKSQGGSIVVHAHDYGNFEKVGDLGTTIVQTNTPIDTVPGDLILYQGSSVCLYYSTNSWNFTRLGKLEGDLSNLRADLGSGNVDITYALAE